MEHLKSIAKHERRLTAITVFMERIANGSFGVLTSEGLRQSLIANARLIPLKRDALGEKIRPIAVGESMRRLVCSAVVRARKAAIEEQGLKAHNLAFSKDGCNVGHKSIDLLLHEELPEDQRGPGALCMLPLLVGTDLEDAYQKASREIVLEKLFASEAFKELVPLYLSLYGGDAKLFIDDFENLLSECGFHQGCPLATWLFVTSISEIVERVIAAYPTITVVGFADDYRFIGPWQDALDAAALYKQLVEAAGHTMQKKKGEIFSLCAETLARAAEHSYVTETDENGSQMMTVCTPDTGVVVLGAPLGNDSWCTEWCVNHVHTVVQPALDAISSLGTHDDKNAAHAAYMLLLHSASKKFSFLLRLVAPTVIKRAAFVHDEAICQCLSRLIGPKSEPLSLLPEDEDEDVHGNEDRLKSWFQATLPVREGGMGLGSAIAISKPAFVASWADFLSFMHTNQPRLFPRLCSAISEQTLTEAMNGAPTPPIARLITAFDQLEKVLTRKPGRYHGGDNLIPGICAIREALGDDVRMIPDLVKAMSGRQHQLTQAMWECYKLQMKQELKERQEGADPSQFAGTSGEHCYLDNCPALTDEDITRLLSCSGPEAIWVSAVPTRPEYRSTSAQWRVNMCHRLRIPHEFLRSAACGGTGPTECDCHKNFDEQTRQIAHQERGAPEARPSNRKQRRTRIRPPPVDPLGAHDLNCRVGGGGAGEAQQGAELPSPRPAEKGPGSTHRRRGGPEIRPRRPVAEESRL